MSEGKKKVSVEYENLSEEHRIFKNLFLMNDLNIELNCKKTLNNYE